MNLQIIILFYSLSIFESQITDVAFPIAKKFEQ